MGVAGWAAGWWCRLWLPWEYWVFETPNPNCQTPKAAEQSGPFKTGNYRGLQVVVLFSGGGGKDRESSIRLLMGGEYTQHMILLISGSAARSQS